jgi:DNA invertase Pin-like site-specific DNA recombinase
MRQAAIYLLGSDEAGRDELQTFVTRRGWSTSALYRDPSTTQRRRPQWNQLMATTRRKQQRPFDLIVTTSVADVFRSMHELVLVIGELHARGVDFVTYNDPVPFDTTTPSGREILRVFGALRDVELARHAANTRRGMARVRKIGARVGRPPRPFDIVRARELRAAGRPLREIAAEVGVPVAVLHRQLVPKGASQGGRASRRESVGARSVH